VVAIPEVIQPSASIELTEDDREHRPVGSALET
jgi:hypothetical protein